MRILLVAAVLLLPSCNSAQRLPEGTGFTVGQTGKTPAVTVPVGGLNLRDALRRIGMQVVTIGTQALVNEAVARLIPAGSGK